MSIPLPPQKGRPNPAIFSTKWSHLPTFAIFFPAKWLNSGLQIVDPPYETIPGFTATHCRKWNRERRSNWHRNYFRLWIPDALRPCQGLSPCDHEKNTFAFDYY